jgi:hypothetical protein
MSTEKSVWLRPAAKHHSPHVVVAALAIMGLYAWQDDPDLILIVVTAVAISGVAAGLIEALRWLWTRVT